MTAPTDNPTLSKTVAEMAPVSRENRPTIVGPDSPEAPFPLRMTGVVERGFGRGSRELGIPTANLPDDSISPLMSLSLTGIYYGFARVYPSTSATSSTSSSTATPTHPQPLSSDNIADLPTHTAPYPDQAPDQLTKRRQLGEDDYDVWPMVMSVGWNPYYNNEKLTAEVHIMHPFPTDFYGHRMSIVVLGYIRPELNYVSKEALIEDINTDVKVALVSLARPQYAAFAADEFLLRPC